MKVSVYKQEDGTVSILVQASPGKGRTPVLIRDVQPAAVKAAVGPVIDAMRRPKGEPVNVPK